MKQILVRVGLTFIVVIVIYLLLAKISNLTTQLDNARNNEKAFIAELSDEKQKNRVFKYDIYSLQKSNDSLVKKMLQVTAENRIKDKNIRSLQYQLEQYNKVDTIYVRDTIFKSPSFQLDTCLMDKWAKTCLHLKYPSTIAVSSSFTNEKYIICSAKKEPIKPRKWFLPRWFTKKHTILEITVVDKNPYIETPKQRFIEIIK